MTSLVELSVRGRVVGILEVLEQDDNRLLIGYEGLQHIQGHILDADELQFVLQAMLSH